MALVLYSFRRCPYAMRARMAIAVSGADPEHREILLRDRPAALRELSSKATVPVLQLDDGTVLDESLDIMRWALGQHDPHRWLPTPDQEAETARLLSVNDGEFKTHLDRFKYDTRYPDSNPLEARSAAEKFVAELDTRLAKQRYLLGDDISLADIAIFPFVRQFVRADVAWFASTGYTGVKRWLATWEASAVFRSIMRKLPTWSPGDPPVRFSAVFTHVA